MGDWIQFGYWGLLAAVPIIAFCAGLIFEKLSSRNKVSVPINTFVALISQPHASNGTIDETIFRVLVRIIRAIVHALRGGDLGEAKRAILRAIDQWEATHGATDRTERLRQRVMGATSFEELDAAIDCFNNKYCT